MDDIVSLRGLLIYYISFGLVFFPDSKIGSSNNNADTAADRPNQRPGNDFEVGGGGKRLPGCKITLPKTKISPDFDHYVLGGTRVHVQKQKTIERYPRSKMGAPLQSKKLEVQAPLLHPPTPGSRAYGPNRKMNTPAMLFSL